MRERLSAETDRQRDESKTTFFIANPKVLVHSAAAAGADNSLFTYDSQTTTTQGVQSHEGPAHPRPASVTDKDPLTDGQIHNLVLLHLVDS